MEKKDFNKSALVIAVITVLLLVAVGYIVYDKYSEWSQATSYATLQQGAQIGYQEAVAQLYQNAVQCQQVPLTIGNESNKQTINLIAVECLQQAQQQAQEQNIQQQAQQVDSESLQQ